MITQTSSLSPTKKQKNNPELKIVELCNNCESAKLKLSNVQKEKDLVVSSLMDEIRELRKDNDKLKSELEAAKNVFSNYLNKKFNLQIFSIFFKDEDQMKKMVTLSINTLNSFGNKDHLSLLKFKDFDSENDQKVVCVFLFSSLLIKIFKFF